jgi:2-polyprenyl-6-hydroxyphenyl methylase/3-demethylubiquinone-9 3-methyltransferase
MTTINRTFLSYALAIGVAEYVLNLLPRGTHEWNKFMTPDEFSSLLRNNRFRITKSSGMSYNPLTVKWSLTSNMSINYYVVAQRSN